jgi:hypothetical protein
MSLPPMAKILPDRAAEELREAAKISDPFERVKAIDKITDRLRSANPALFKGEPDDEADRNQR